MTAPPGDARDPHQAPGGGRRHAARADSRVIDLVRRLGSVLAEHDLSEVEVRWGEVRVRVQRSAPVAAAPAGGVTGPAAPAPPGTADVGSSALVTIEAPMVGTFYRASSPTAEPYVREGDLVKHGQIVGIIEAMKLMNEIESKVSGLIAKILVENGQPVEYGQPLCLIDPRR